MDQAERQLKEEKAHSIGGSDAAIIALEAAGKKPPFGRSAFDIWLRLTGRLPKEEQEGESDRLEMGRLLEEPVAQRFTRKTGLLVKPVPQLIHPKYPWYTGHLDRVVDDPEHPADLECKTVEFDPLGEWSDPAEGEEQRVPLSYLLQITWYLGLPRDVDAFQRMMYLAAQFGLSGALRVYRWQGWDPALQRIHARMLESNQRFWEDNILKDDPPPMSHADPEAARRWLDFRHPANKDMEIVAAENQAAFVEIAAAYKDAAEKKTFHEAEQKRLGAELAAIIGDHYGTMGQAGGMVGKATRPLIEAQTAAFTDWPGLVAGEKLNVSEETIQKYTRISTIREAYRRIDVRYGEVGKVNTKPPRKR